MRPGDLARLAPLASSAYFLDVDGTLFEIKPRPENVVADETLRTLLAGLAGAARGALALVSERAIKDIDGGASGAASAFEGGWNFRMRDRAIAATLPAFDTAGSSAAASPLH
jgi:trehalose-phosphatase